MKEKSSAPDQENKQKCPAHDYLLPFVMTIGCRTCKPFCDGGHGHSPSPDVCECFYPYPCPQWDQVPQLWALQQIAWHVILHSADNPPSSLLPLLVLHQLHAVAGGLAPHWNCWVEAHQAHWSSWTQIPKLVLRTAPSLPPFLSLGHLLLSLVYSPSPDIPGPEIWQLPFHKMSDATPLYRINKDPRDMTTALPWDVRCNTAILCQPSPSRSVTRKLSNSFKIRQENTIPNRVEQEEEKRKKPNLLWRDCLVTTKHIRLGAICIT